jgi:hypothetical protein
MGRGNRALAIVPPPAGGDTVSFQKLVRGVTSHNAFDKLHTPRTIVNTRLTTPSGLPAILEGSFDPLGGSFVYSTGDSTYYFDILPSDTDYTWTLLFQGQNIAITKDLLEGCLDGQNADCIHGEIIAPIVHLRESPLTKPPAFTQALFMQLLQFIRQTPVPPELYRYINQPESTIKMEYFVDKVRDIRIYNGKIVEEGEVLYFPYTLFRASLGRLQHALPAESVSVHADILLKLGVQLGAALANRNTIYMTDILLTLWEHYLRQMGLSDVFLKNSRLYPWYRTKRAAHCVTCMAGLTLDGMCPVCLHRKLNENTVLPKSVGITDAKAKRTCYPYKFLPNGVMFTDAQWLGYFEYWLGEDMVRTAGTNEVMRVIKEWNYLAQTNYQLRMPEESLYASCGHIYGADGYCHRNSCRNASSYGIVRGEELYPLQVFDKLWTLSGTNQIIRIDPLGDQQGITGLDVILQHRLTGKHYPIRVIKCANEVHISMPTDQELVNEYICGARDKQRANALVQSTLDAFGKLISWLNAELIGAETETAVTGTPHECPEPELWG